MEDYRQVTFLVSQSIAALIEAMGMQAENKARELKGHSLAYDEVAFNDVINRYGLGHNAAVDILRR